MELDSVVIVILLAVIGSVRAATGELGRYGDLVSVLKIFETQAERFSTAMPSVLRTKKCETRSLEGNNHIETVLVYEFGSNSCGVTMKSTNSIPDLDSEELISKFKHEIDICNKKIRDFELAELMSNRNDLHTTASTPEPLKAVRISPPEERDSSDWGLLIRALMNFVGHDVLQSHVIYRQNIEKYTHVEDDGSHLRVIIALNDVKCELQIYKRPSNEGEHARVCHEHGPDRSQKSHYVKAREDRRFQLPNCAVLFATKKSKPLIDSFIKV